MSLGEAGEDGAHWQLLCSHCSLTRRGNPGVHRAKTGSKAQGSSSHQAWPGDRVTQTQVAAGSHPCQVPGPLCRGVRSRFCWHRGKEQRGVLGFHWYCCTKPNPRGFFPLRNTYNASGPRGVSVLGQQIWQELGMAPPWHRNSSGARAVAVKSKPG